MKPLIRLFRHLKSSIAAYGLSTLMVSMRNFIITYLTAYLSRSVVQAVEGGMNALWSGMLFFAIALLAFLVWDAFGVYWWETTIQRMMNTLKTKTYNSVLHAPQTDVDRYGQRAQVLTRMNTDVDIASGILRYSILTPLMVLVSGIGATVSIAAVDWILALTIYAIGILALGLQAFLAQYMRRASKLIQDIHGRTLSLFSNAFVYALQIKMMRLSGYLIDLFSGEQKDYEKQNQILARINGISGGVQGIVGLFSDIGVLFICIFMYAIGRIELANVLFITQLAALIITMVTSFGAAYTGFVQASVGINRIDELLGLPSEAEQDRGLMDFVPDADAPLFECDHLTCILSETSIIDDLCFRIQSGRISAIVGDSGRGKTTLFRLMLGIYP